MRGDRRGTNAGGQPPPRSPLARRWWLNLVLLVLIGALAVFAWYRSAQPPEAGKPPLTALNPDTVRRISIERLDTPAAVLERVEDGWRFNTPLKARADTIAVDSLLRLARAPIDATVNPADTDLSRYGLDRPALRVRFDDTEIRFGDMHPLHDSHYVQHGAQVSLISSRYFAQAAGNYTRLLDSRLIEPGRRPVAFTLPGFRLTRNDATWQRQPEIPALSSDRINAFVDNWQHARALQVGKSSAPKTNEQAVISFEDGSRITFGIAARTPELILVRPDEGLEYRLPAETGERLLTLVPDSPQ